MMIQESEIFQSQRPRFGANEAANILMNMDDAVSFKNQDDDKEKSRFLNHHVYNPFIINYPVNLAQLWEI